MHIIFNQGGFLFIHFQPPHFASPSMASLTHGNSRKMWTNKWHSMNPTWGRAQYLPCQWSNQNGRLEGISKANECMQWQWFIMNKLCIDWRSQERVCCNCRLFLQGVLQLLPAASTLKRFCRKIDFQASTTQPLDLTNMFVCSAAKCYAVQVNLSTARTKSEASMVCCFYSSCQL